MTDFWKQRRVAVTGGGGFLGYHLVQALLARGANVRTFGLPPIKGHPLLHMPGVDNQFGDVLDPVAVTRALADREVVFHTAGLVAVWGPALAKMHVVHNDGTRNVLAAAPKARIVHTSSIMAVGAHPTETVLNEDAPFNLDDVRIDYVLAKRRAEEIALEAASRGQDVVAVNPGCLLGPEDYEGSVMGRLCLRTWKGRMLAAPAGGFNFVDVRDVALGHLLAAERGQAGRRYILGNVNLRMDEFIRQLNETAGWKPRWLPRVPGWFMGLAAGVGEMRGWWSQREPYPAPQHVRMNRYYWYFDITRARTELGFEPRSITETLADTYRWHCEYKPWTLRGFNRWWLRPTQKAA